MVPCVDFGHLNSRTFGNVQTKKDFNDIFEIIADRIGEARLKTIHIHFSKIEYTITGGEKKHLTFEDKIFGPDYFPLIELLVERNIKPIVICESDGTQAEDAAMMRNIYDLLRKTKNNE
jgi:deoxyribonuclease-4